jgi:hypothetical protein
VSCGHQLSAHLSSLGGAESGVQSVRLPPVAAASVGIACGVLDPGEAVVGARLLVLIADLAGQAECDGVLGAGLSGPTGSE